MFAIDIFLPHIHACDATVGIGGVIIAASIGIAATAVARDIVHSGPHLHTAHRHGNGLENAKKLIHSVFLGGKLRGIQFYKGCPDKPGSR